MLKLLIAISFLFFTPHLFAITCKGASKSACENSDKCYWTNGKKMKSHCRTNPGKGTAKKSTKGKKKKAKKSTKSKDNKTSKKDKKAKSKKDKKKSKSSKKDKKKKKKKGKKKKSKKSDK